MGAVEDKAGQHFKSVREGKFKPQFVPAMLRDDPWMVLVGNIPLHLEDYYACQRTKDRQEARRLVGAPQCPHPFFKKDAKVVEENVRKETCKDSMIDEGADQKKTV